MIKILFALIALLSSTAGNASAAAVNPGARQFKYSMTVEKERPELSEETKKLIAAYRKNPTQENYDALRRQAEANYDKVLARKKAKLEELRQTAKHAAKITEMEEIVNEMIKDRENRINQTMSRFTDSRLRPHSRESKDGWLPVLGAAQNVSIAYTPVTNGEYAQFLQETGRNIPADLQYLSAGKKDYPAVNVSYADAEAYCQWLTLKDGAAKYRLPTEAEWELAAGHMPKDADMNCGERKSLTPVTAYKQTLAACGAVDMWGNVWEWTSTARGAGQMAVKGGSWNSARTDCRTEYRGESRNAAKGYETVGFRVVREK